MSDDQRIQRDVLDELAWEPSIGAGHIGVTVKNGIVSLTGHVDGFMEKLAAETAAGRVRGVKAVAEEIEVRLPFDNARDDEEIAAAAVSRLAWNPSIPADAIKVKVEQGWVTLTGEVAWYYQKELVTTEVRMLRGVVGVSNFTTIKPQIDASELSDDIMHALHRSYFFDRKQVSVHADGGNITLDGTVSSWHDRRIAAETAWAAPGARAVQNNIAVG